MKIPKKDLYRRWTESAINCYNRRCQCSGCTDEEICKQQRRDPLTKLIPMKYAVLVLFALHGAPKKRRVYYEPERYGNDDN